MEILTVPFGSRDYFVFLVVMLFGRGVDLASTRIGTPNLQIEGNPVMRRLGWTGGVLMSVAISAGLALLPVQAIAVATASVLVAVHNLERAWLMRAMGETRYITMECEHLEKAHWPLYYFCLFMQTGLIAILGIVLLCFSNNLLVPAGMGMGFICYAVIFLAYTLLSVWRPGR